MNTDYHDITIYQVVQMATFNWSTVETVTKGEWNFVTKDNGGRCVMTFGGQRMLQPSVTN